MGLYLCVFAAGDDDDELDGVEVGSYDDFARLREAVAQLDGQFPVLMEHADSDGRWSAEECSTLELELLTIADEFHRLPPRRLPEGWQADVARDLGITPVSLYESFIDVDGEPLLDRLIELARLASRENQPILFQ